jgi:hypothetical protein
VFQVGTAALGSGVLRSTAVTGSVVDLQTNSANRWEVGTAGHLIAYADNTYDIGASGANRPRNVFVAGNLTTGGASIRTGSVPTLTGTCTTGSQVGGNTAGKFTATCTAQTVIMTFATTAPTGWTCDAHDNTTPADALNQTAYSTTSCTLTGTTVAGDVITFHAVGW